MLMADGTALLLPLPHLQVPMELEEAQRESAEPHRGRARFPSILVSLPRRVRPTAELTAYGPMAAASVPVTRWTAMVLFHLRG